MNGKPLLFFLFTKTVNTNQGLTHFTPPYQSMGKLIIKFAREVNYCASPAGTTSTIRIPSGNP